MEHLVGIDWNPSPRKLRQFGLLACAVFAVAAFAAWHERGPFSAGLGPWRSPVTWALAAVAGLSAGAALIWPRGNRPLYLTLSVLGFPIGLGLSYVILAALFFLLLTPIAMILRALGRDPLGRAADPAARSYWHPAPPERPSADYFRQF